ncbi:MAG: RDD family protein [Calditrichaceae bacterium]|nr:RDD family protein [Calditrichaceae bacterium]MBN2708698.1 RDD family protein [Calditrichaceae bacterium]RQV92810.1 MAG: RDD family protein [Calditrichota bacterium]
MDTIRVQTAQNVDLEYEIASIGDRILAYLLDAVFLIAYLVVVMIITAIIFGSGLDHRYIGWIFLLLLPYLFYDLLCETLMDGQSFGKKLRQIKVIRIDGSQPTLGNYLLRWLLRLVDIGLSYGGVALLTILINGKGQRLGDLAAGTTVIKLVKRTEIKDTIFTNVEDTYQPVFRQVVNLDDKTIEIIKEVLNTFLDEDRHGLTRQKLTLKTQRVIENKLGLKSGMEAKPFLQTILKDYNYLKGKI